ncbi:unnamed protein product [Alopecurus aequalis]
MHRRRWRDLPPDLLHVISGHLHDASDFARFHAVCKTWRSSHEPTCARKNTTTDQFLPWLLAPNKEDDDSLELRCVFSKSTYLAPPPPTSGIGRNWVASADGTAVCYFTSDYFFFHDGPTLHDALTGAPLMHLPLFLDGQPVVENPCGIIYNDGTILLYNELYNSEDHTAKIKVALLRPGDDEWTVIQRILQSPKCGQFCITYYAGKILVTVQHNLWHMIPLITMPSTGSDDDVMLLRPSSMPLPHDGYFYNYSHVLESCGELLWASVHLSVDYTKEGTAKGVPGLVRALSVSVHALDKAPTPRWVRKEGISLADRVLFLGWPNSFAVDASKLGVTGGVVYFMDCNDDDSCPERHGVFRYNLIDNKTEFVEWLPTGWSSERCTWLIP